MTAWPPWPPAYIAWQGSNPPSVFHRFSQPWPIKGAVNDLRLPRLTEKLLAVA